MSKNPCPVKGTASHDLLLKQADGDADLATFAYIRNGHKYRGLTATKVQGLKNSTSVENSPPIAKPDITPAPSAAPNVLPREAGNAARIAGLEAAAAVAGIVISPPVAPAAQEPDSFSALAPERQTSDNLIAVTRYNVYSNLYAEPDKPMAVQMMQIKTGLRRDRLWTEAMADKMIVDMILAERKLAKTVNGAGDQDSAELTRDDAEELLAQIGNTSFDMVETGADKGYMTGMDSALKAVDNHPISKLFIEVMGVQTLTEAITHVQEHGRNFSRSYPEMDASQLERHILLNKFSGIDTGEKLLAWSRDKRPSEIGNDVVGTFRAFVGSLIVKRADGELDPRYALKFLRRISLYGTQAVASTANLTPEAMEAIDWTKPPTHKLKVPGRPELGTKPSVRFTAETRHTPADRLTSRMPQDAAGVMMDDATRKLFLDYLETGHVFERSKKTGELVPRALPGFDPEAYVRTSPATGAAAFKAMHAKAVKDRIAAQAAGDTASVEKLQALERTYGSRKTAGQEETQLLRNITVLMGMVFRNHELAAWIGSGYASIAYGKKDYAAFVMRDMVGFRKKGEGSLMWKLYRYVRDFREGIPAGQEAEFKQQVMKIVQESLTNRRIGKAMGGKGASSDSTSLKNFLESGTGRNLATKVSDETGKVRTAKYASAMDDVVREILTPYYIGQGLSDVEVEDAFGRGLHPGTEEAVPLLAIPGGTKSDSDLADVSRYSSPAGETPLQVLDATLAQAYYNPQAGADRNYASFWLPSGDKGTAIVSLPRGMLSDENGVMPATYGMAWEKAMSFFSPYYGNMKPKHRSSLLHGGPTPSEVGGGVQAVQTYAVPLGFVDKAGGTVTDDVSAHGDGSIIASPAEWARHQSSAFEDILGAKNHGLHISSEVGDQVFMKGYTSSHGLDSVAPGSPQHAMQQAIFDAMPGLGYIVGMGTIKASDFLADKAMLQGLRAGKLSGPGLHTTGFRDINVGSKILRVIEMEIPITWRGAAHLSASTELHGRAAPAQLITDVAFLDPAGTGIKVAEAASRARMLGLALGNMLDEEFGTALSPTEIAELIEDPIQKSIAVAFATKHGLSANHAPLLMYSAIPRMTARLTARAKIWTLGAKMTMVESGMYLDKDHTKNGITHSITGVLDFALTGYADYRVVDGRIYGCLVRANYNDHRARFGLFVKKGFTIEEVKALVVEIVTNRRMGNNDYADNKFEELIPMLVHSHGKGGITDRRTVLDDLVTADGKFDENTLRRNALVEAVAKAAGAEGSPYIAGTQLGSLDRVPGVVMSSHLIAPRISEPVAWVERDVTYKKWGQNEAGEKVLVDVTEKLWAPSLANEAAYHPELIKDAGKDFDGDADFTSTWATEANGERAKIPARLLKGDVIENLTGEVREFMAKAIKGNAAKYGKDTESLSDDQRESRRQMGDNQADKYRMVLANYFLDEVQAAAVKELLGIKDLRDNNKMRPVIDTETQHKAASVPLSDDADRVNFLKDEASVKLLRQRFAEAGWNGQDSAHTVPEDFFTDTTVKWNRMWRVPPMVLLEIKRGPAREVGSYEGARRKDIADKYGVKVREFMASVARALSHAAVGGASFDVGTTRMVRIEDKETGKSFLWAPEELGVSGRGRQRKYLEDGVLFNGDQTVAFGRRTSDGNYNDADRLASLGYVTRFVADNLNMIIDAIKSDYPEVAAFRLTSEFLTVEIGLLLSENFTSYDEVREFHSKFMEWADSPMGQAVRISAIEEDLPFQPKMKSTMAWGKGKFKAQHPEGRYLNSVSDRTFERIFREAVVADPRVVKAEGRVDVTSPLVPDWFEAIRDGENGRDIFAKAHDIAMRYTHIASVYGDISGLDGRFNITRNAPHSAEELTKALGKFSRTFNTVDFRNTAYVGMSLDAAALVLTPSFEIHKYNIDAESRDHETLASLYRKAKQAAIGENEGSSGGKGDAYRSKEYLASFLATNAALAGLSPAVLALVSSPTIDNLMWVTHAAFEQVYQALEATGDANALVSAMQLPLDPKLMVDKAFRRISFSEGADLLQEHLEAYYAAGMSLPSVVIHPGGMHVPDHVKEETPVTSKDLLRLLAGYSSVVYGANLSTERGGLLAMMPPALLADMTRRTLNYARTPSEDTVRLLARRFIGEKVGGRIERSAISYGLRKRFGKDVYNVPVTDHADFIPTRSMKYDPTEAEVAHAEVEQTPDAIQSMSTMILVEMQKATDSASSTTLASVHGLFDFASTLDPSIFPHGSVTAAVRAGLWKAASTIAGEGDAGFVAMVSGELTAAKTAGLQMNPVKGASMAYRFGRELDDQTRDALQAQYPWFLPLMSNVMAFTTGKIDKLSLTELEKWSAWVEKNVVQDLAGEEDTAAAESEESGVVPAVEEDVAPDIAPKEMRIVSAAVTIEGDVLQGMSHAEAILRTHPKMTTEQIDKIRFSEDAGFMVKAGNVEVWQSREAASDVAHANGQIKPEYKGEKVLHSNMVSFSALAEFGKADRVLDDSVVSSLAYAKIRSRGSWDNAVNLLFLDRWAEDGKPNLKRYRELNYRDFASSWQPIIDTVKNAGSYRQAMFLVTHLDAMGGWPTAELREEVLRLANYMPPRKWHDALVNAARENPEHRYNKWLSLKTRMAIMEDSPRKLELFSEVRTEGGLMAKVDAAYRNLVLNHYSDRGAGRRLSDLLGRYERPTLAQGEHGLSTLSALAPLQEGMSQPTVLTAEDRADWVAFREGEYQHADPDSIEVARKQGILYRGLNPSTLGSTIRKNADGSLTLLPQSNMGGRVSSVAMTPYRFVAWDYATRDYANGTSQHASDNGPVLTIKATGALLDGAIRPPLMSKEEADRTIADVENDPEPHWLPEDSTNYDEWYAEASLERGPGDWDTEESEFDYTIRRVKRGVRKAMQEQPANPATSEKAEEVSFAREVTVPAGQWRMDHVSFSAVAPELPSTSYEHSVVMPEDLFRYETRSGSKTYVHPAYHGRLLLAMSGTGKSEALARDPKQIVDTDDLVPHTTEQDNATRHKALLNLLPKITELLAEGKTVVSASVELLKYFMPVSVVIADDAETMRLQRLSPDRENILSKTQEESEAGYNRFLRYTKEQGIPLGQVSRLEKGDYLASYLADDYTEGFYLPRAAGLLASNPAVARGFGDVISTLKDALTASGFELTSGNVGDARLFDLALMTADLPSSQKEELEFIHNSAEALSHLLLPAAIADQKEWKGNREGLRGLLEARSYELYREQHPESQYEESMWSRVMDLARRLIDPLRKVTPAALQRMSQAVDEVLVQRNFTSLETQAPEGTTALDYAKAILSHPSALVATKALNDAGIPYGVTGSIAYAAGGILVNRDANIQLHDLDIVVHPDDLERATTAIATAIYESGGMSYSSSGSDYLVVVPSSRYSIQMLRTMAEGSVRFEASWNVVDGDTGLVVGSRVYYNRLDGSAYEKLEGMRALIVDLMEDEHISDLSAANRLDVAGTIVAFSKPKPGIMAKLGYLRRKDIADYRAMRRINASPLAQVEPKYQDDASISAIPEDTVVNTPPEALKNLIKNDPLVNGFLSPEDLQPVSSDPAKYKMDPEISAGLQELSQAGEIENRKPLYGSAPRVSFSAVYGPLDSKDESDVICGWPKGAAPDWKIYSLANPRLMMQGEIEYSSRLRGQNARLETLQHFAEWSGVHKTRADRLVSRLNMLFGLDLRDYIRKMYQIEVPVIAGIDASDSLYSDIDMEMKVDETLRGTNVKSFIESGGVGWGFSLPGGVMPATKGGRLIKPGAADVYTPEERRDTELFMEALKGILSGERILITAIRSQASRGKAGFLEKAMLEKMKKLLPANTYARVELALKNQTEAQLEDNGYLKYSEATDEYALTLPVTGVTQGFESTAAWKKLRDAGRDSKFLKPEYVVKMVRKFLDQELADYQRNAPWFMTKEVGFRKNYFPMEFGTGWYAKGVDNIEEVLDREVDKTPDTIAAEKQSEYEKMLQKAGVFEHGRFVSRPAEDASDKTLQYLHDLMLRRVPESRKGALGNWNGRVIFLAQIKGGFFEDFGLTENADFASLVHLTYDLTMKELFLRKMQQDDKTREGLAGEIAGVDPVAMARALKKQLRSMPTEEPAFTRRRAFKTHEEAWEKAGLLPSASGLTDTLKRYGDKGMEQAARKMTLNNLLLCTDHKGKPLVMALPNLEYEEEHGVIEDPVWETAARMWAGYFEAPYDESQTGRQNAHRIVSSNVSGQAGAGIGDSVSGRFNFITVPTTYASVSAWYGTKDAPGESNILDLLQGGESAAILKQLMDSTKYSNVYRALSVVNDTTAWMKTAAMQFSLFHPGAIAEDVAAGTKGLGLLPKAFRDKFKHYGANSISPYEIYRMMKTDSPYLASLRTIMEAVGITWCYGHNNATDIRLDSMRGQLSSAEAYVREHNGETAAKNFREVMELLTQEQTSFVFEYLNNIGKTLVVHGILMGMRNKATEQGVAFDPVAALRPMAQEINEAVGGLNFTQYSWYTPQVRQLGNLTLFSLQWTMGAWNAAGGALLTGKLFDTKMTPEAAEFAFKRRLPWMVGLVMVLQPMAWQLGAYLAAKAMGGGDPDDKPWMWDNEADKKSFADITPIARMSPFYKGDPSGKRRVYIRWGKQLHETMSWFEDPMKTLGGKSSLAVSMSYGLVTGKSLGTEWNLGFHNEGLSGWFSGKNGFMDSRLAYVGQRMVPVLGTFSIGGFMRNPDAGFANFFASTSKGTSYYAATQRAQEVLKGWADKDNYRLLMSDEKKRVNLHALLADILDDASRNGYDAEKVLNASRAAIMKDLYAKFYKALDGNDAEELGVTSRELMRLNGAVEQARSSVRNRNSLYGKPADLTPDQEKALEEAWREPEAKARKELRRIERSSKNRKPKAAEQVEALRKYLGAAEGVDPRLKQSAAKGGSVHGFLDSDDVPASVLGYRVVPQHEHTEDDNSFFRSNKGIAGHYRMDKETSNAG